MTGAVDGDNRRVSQKHVQFAEGQFVLERIDRIENDEQVVAVFLDFRALALTSKNIGLKSVDGRVV